MIDPKAILAGRVHRGVPTGAIVSITISSLCLAGILGLFLLTGGPIFIIATILSVVTLIPMLAGVMALDRLEPEPRHLLVMVFLWGAGASVVLSIIFSLLGEVILRPGLGDDVEIASAIVIAPIIEEITKALVLFGLFWWRRSEINGITDGVVYAAVCGLGFAAAENIGYYIAAAFEGGGASMAGVFILRGILSPFCHPVFTAMTGISLAIAIHQQNRAVRFFLPLAGLVLAISLHSIWNASALIGIEALGFTFLFMLGVLVSIVVGVRVDRKRTLRRLQACLMQYTHTGLVTSDDLYMLSTLKARKQARNWARATYGKNGFNAMRDYQQACTKLTMLHDQVNDGLMSAQQFEALRGGLLTLMSLARDAFLGPNHPAEPMMHLPPQA
ncbi:MAG: PrsW family intramembrane metalloprotease [Coriobacteriia bacterium]|nr:PrsW family intramembrane metalloprotease [Coriobacteriia bacterium]MCL2749966.1 PrsW family intramembrane metalloprotease [Coriobacteriia bacterium]